MSLRILIAAGVEHNTWATATARARGHETSTAATASEAWQMLRTSRYDLILLGRAFPDSTVFADSVQRRRANIPLAGLDSLPRLAENLDLDLTGDTAAGERLGALLQRYEERRNMVKQSVELAAHTVELRTLSKELRAANRRLTCLVGTTRKLFALENEERILAELLRAAGRFSRKAPSLVLVERRRGLAVRMGMKLNPEQVQGAIIPVADHEWKRTRPFRRLSDPTVDEKVLELLGTQDYCSLPLRARGKTFGLMVLGCRPEDTDRTALHSLTGSGATAMYNRRRERDLRTLAEQDALTRLPNYQALQRYLRLEIKRHARSGQPLTVAMLDIDYFKQINDTHGHLTGDKTLRHLADLMKRELRETDTVARYGGEEFVILMPGTPREHASGKIADLLQTIRRIKLPRTGPLTLSAGMASFPDDGGTPHALLEAADRALYHAKEDGRDRATTYTEWLERSFSTDSDNGLNGDAPGDHP